MKKEILLTVPSYFRDDMNIRLFRFGKGEKSCIIVGALRGDEIQQIYVCARLVSILRDIEKDGGIISGKTVTIIPTAIGASMNTGTRLWGPENMDLNRRFPGDPAGSTTERIAHALLERLSSYIYGVQLTSFYQPGSFIPHVRMMNTGHQNPELGLEFGLPYVYVREPRTADHTTLNYNWQLAVSLSCLYHVINTRLNLGLSTIISTSDLTSVSATTAGLFRRVKLAGAHVRKGEQLGFIMNPLDGSIREVLKTPVTGTLFFVQDGPFITEHSVVFNILSSKK